MSFSYLGVDNAFKRAALPHRLSAAQQLLGCEWQSLNARLGIICCSGDRASRCERLSGIFANAHCERRSQRWASPLGQ